LAAGPALAPLLTERTRHFAGQQRQDTPPGFDVHVAALRDAGFREVDTIWQALANRVVLAVRQARASSCAPARTSRGVKRNTQCPRLRPQAQHPGLAEGQLRHRLTDPNLDRLPRPRLHDKPLEDLRTSRAFLHRTYGRLPCSLDAA